MSALGRLRLYGVTEGDIPVLLTKRPLDLMITDIACQDFKMARLKKGTIDAGFMGLSTGPITVK